MAIRFSTGLRDKLLGTNSFKDIFADGVIYIYSGIQPASADDPVQGTKLGEVTQDAGNFSFGSATNGLEFGTPSDGAIDKDGAENWKFEGLADGTAGWFRLMGNDLDDLGSSTTLPRMDGAIGTYGKDLNLSTTSITKGAPYTIDVFKVILPASK
ncbi:hypothetical protein [Thiohalorhabdus sp.]|uniref:hypothetical protein n=1 Tax=Thiohalorhabdus sp. TaxID=3094134 RepID=UPI002FC2FCE0